MVEVPGGEWAETAPSARPPFAANWKRLPAKVEHVFTHFRLLLDVHVAACDLDAPEPAGCWWAPADDLPRIGLPSLMAKVVEAAVPGATRGRGA
jgi:A/G-specific adenine glycosylase